MCVSICKCVNKISTNKYKEEQFEKSGPQRERKSSPQRGAFTLVVWATKDRGSHASPFTHISTLIRSDFRYSPSS